MNVNLISRDRELHRLCSEILADLPGLQCALSVEGVHDGGPEPDICLWDFDPNAPLPPTTGSATRLYLVHRKDLTAFNDMVGSADTAVVLKPVTRGALAAFLSYASAGRNGAGEPGYLRSDCNDLLQSLIQANLKIQEYDQDRTNFLTRAVHDFRAPLTALRGYCDLLLGELMGPLSQNQKEVLRRMQHSAERLTRMAAGMFELSIGRHAKVRPELCRGDLRDCVEQAFHEITPFADEKRISLTVNLEPCEDALYFESRHIEQLLINLLDNACKFAPKAGAISIHGAPYFWERRSAQSPVAIPKDRRRRSSRRPNSYRVDVQDSGMPIPAGHLERIFEEYVSYPSGSDRDGAGLGLAICKMIVTQHEGRIWAENTSLGPVFSFVLPLVAAKPLHSPELVGVAPGETV